MLEGRPDAEIAASLKITDSAVTSFRKRHASELQSHIETAVAQVLEPAITLKAERLKAQNERWSLARQVIAERAADPTWAHVPGWKTGLLVHQHKMIGSGRDAEVVDEFAFDAALFKAVGDVEHQAAQELGELPQPTTTDNRSMVFVRQYIGFDPTALE